MKYRNAAEILPEKLLQELQIYAGGELLYIPKNGMKQEWGTASGSRAFYLERNQEMRERYEEGTSIMELSEQYGLAYSTVKKIIYQ